MVMTWADLLLGVSVLALGLIIYVIVEDAVQECRRQEKENDCEGS